MGKPHKNKQPLKVYGYSVAYKKSDEDIWKLESDEDIPLLPAHYDFAEMATDRVAYLREKGFHARALALLACDSDLQNLEAKEDE